MHDGLKRGPAERIARLIKDIKDEEQKREKKRKAKEEREYTEPAKQNAPLLEKIRAVTSHCYTGYGLPEVYKDTKSHSAVKTWFRLQLVNINNSWKTLGLALSRYNNFHFKLCNTVVLFLDEFDKLLKAESNVRSEVLETFCSIRNSSDTFEIHSIVAIEYNNFFRANFLADIDFEPKKVVRDIELAEFLAAEGVLFSGNETETFMISSPLVRWLILQRAISNVYSFCPQVENPFHLSSRTLDILGILKQVVRMFDKKIINLAYDHSRQHLCL
ncbi:3793_t:CDS:2 [Ambispora gerdemannii]|uniref:3793_t:CDS:1 n=1 Tax=Ambispora gerdemannii TaxID=144530 RepID=A0A9N9A980_9GLOM|nr:3793_t:CDS:2 [Ambispora gerdemannii]